MRNRTYGAVGAAAVVLIAVVAVISVGGVPLGDAPADATVTPDGANATAIHHDGSHLSLEGAPNRTVSGETDLAPGTELSVRLVSDEAGSPFLVAETTVDDGTFTATVDLSHVADDASAWATVARDGVELANVSARIHAVEGATPTDSSEGAESGPTLVYDGDRLTLAALENETVRGETGLAAGSEVAVRLASTSSASPFLVRETVPIGNDGTFAAEIDLVGVVNGTTFEATVRHEGAKIASAGGVVIGGKNAVSATNTSEANWTTAPVNETGPVAEETHSTALDYEGDALALESAPNQTVVGETDLAAGTDVTVRLKSTGGASPFLKGTTATVTEGGRFRTAVNMSLIPSGTGFEVSVRHGGDQIAHADGEVVE